MLEKLKTEPVLFKGVSYTVAGLCGISFFIYKIIQYVLGIEIFAISYRGGVVVSGVEALITYSASGLLGVMFLFAGAHYLFKYNKGRPDKSPNTTPKDSEI